MRQQASALTTRLENKIRARVDSSPVGRRDRVEGMKLRHQMLLVVPSLEDYELELLSLAQGDSLYPVFAQLKDEPSEIIENEAELLDWLRSAFSSGITRRALGSILSLVE